MRPLSLTINGQPADLPASLKGLVKLQQARALLADLAARWGVGALSVTLPASRINQGIFGVDKLHAQGRNKFGFYTDYAAEVRSGGELFAGTFRLTSLKNGYTGTFIGDMRSWAVLLGDKKLTDLRFPLVDYDGSQLESTLGLDCDATDLQFPLVAYGNFFAPPETRTLPDGTSQEVPAPPSAMLTYPMSVDDYPPGVYYGNVLRQIFASVGWQLRGRELDSDFWRSIVLTPAGADLDGAWNWGRLLQAKATDPGAQVFSYYQSGPGTGYTNNAVGFYRLPGDGPELSGDIFFLPILLRTAALLPTRALDQASATYTAPRDGVYDFSWSATLTGGHNYFGGPNIDQHDPFVQALLRPVGMGLVLRRDGQSFEGGEGGLLRGDPNAGPLSYAAGQDRVLTPQRLDASGAGLGQLSLRRYAGEVKKVYLEAGDSVTLCVFGRRCVFDGQNNLLAYRSQGVYEFGSPSLACTHYADNDGVSKELLQPADFLPPLSCAEVVKDFLLRTDSFIAPDPARRVATLYSRAELSRAAGEPLDLSGLCDPEAVEYQPAAGADVGSITFAPVALTDDALVAETADIVTAPIGPGEAVQAISSQFAVAGFRTYYTRTQPVVLPCLSNKDLLAQNCSDVAWDINGMAPRLLRYLGPTATRPIPFGQGWLPLAQSAWDGALSWDGEAGAVASYYQQTLRRCTAGHLARFSAPLTPAQFSALTPGRRVDLHGAPYTIESIDQWDSADEAALATITLALDN